MIHRRNMMEVVGTNGYFHLVPLEENFTFSFTETIEYNIGDGWVTLAGGTTSPSITNKNIYIRANLEPEYADDKGIGIFTLKQQCNASGSLLSLLYGDDFANYNTLPDGAFVELFKNCTGLINPPELPFKLSSACYRGMFKGCTKLISVPKLPQIDLKYSCYKSMFRLCESLTTAPDLPATVLTPNCYESMFNECYNLIKPPVISAITTAQYCCLSMFKFCTNLEIGPELLAESLTYGCYETMFHACSSLKYVKILATDISAENCLLNWVLGVTSEGTLVKRAGIEISAPVNWIVEEI